VWRADENALYWVDIPQQTIFSRSFTDGSVRRWVLPEMVGCIAPVKKNEWIAAMETGIFGIALGADGDVKTTQLAAVRHSRESMRFNDGRCDRQGRFWASSMYNNMAAATRVGSLYCYENVALRCVLEEQLIVGNGLAFSASGKTMYVSDSHPDIQKVWRYDYDVDAGVPTNRREFIDMQKMAGRPDGAAVDIDDCYWICANDGGAVYRFAPDGRLDRTIKLPIKKPAMCAFGGPRMDTLFITSIRPANVDLSDQPHAGGLFALYPRVQGLADPAFAG
jgi:sugar lactone lactonase YvrE